MIVKAFLGLALFGCFANAQQQVEFSTLSGPVRGDRTTVNGKSIDVFLSIPFAKPPTGSLRFKPPKSVDPWTTTLDATKPSPACIQSNPNTFITNPNYPIYYSGTFSEDCLYLNIWKPSTTNRNSRLPVMLYMYGGGFSNGMKDVPLYSGQFLSAMHDVIVVSINYRVGVLGFGYLGQDTLPGNLGLLDQLEAMKWVQKNIEYIGGDPLGITIFGQSAGSWSVGLHLLSPMSTTYFDKAIMQSGSPLSKILNAVTQPEEARQKLIAFTKAIGCPTYTDRDIYTCLMDATTDTLMNGINTVTAQGINFQPVVEGPFLPESPLDLMNSGLYEKTNVLMGITKDEYSAFTNSMVNYSERTLRATGQKLSFEIPETVFGFLPIMNGLSEENVEAIKVFYKSSVSNPDEEVVNLLTHIGSDLLFNCPAHLHGSLASVENDVYFYVYNYRLSTNDQPLWAGLSHGYELEATFGLPFDPSRNYTDDDREVSRMMMTYWTNFAKTGNPNSPPDPLRARTNWPTFNNTDQLYMEINPDRSFTTRQGPRRHECAFINEILPHVNDERMIPQPCEWPHRPNAGTTVRLDIQATLAVVVAAAAVMLRQ